MKYTRNYYELLFDGLDRMRLTDNQGKNISQDEGMKLWADNVQNVKENTHGLLFYCGNGASATMAEHMSHDWFQNAEVNTTTCAETAHITAISNDYSYEDVFSYRINRILSERDMLIAISSSGNSPNIVKAVEAAKTKGAFVVTLSGMKEDNKIRQMGDLNFYVPLDTYGEVESAHAVLLHCALDYYLDTYMGGRH